MEWGYWGYRDMDGCTHGTCINFGSGGKSNEKIGGEEERKRDEEEGVEEERGKGRGGG